MKKFIASAAAALGLAAAAPAFADVHRIPANDTSSITFFACRSFELLAMGDEDTDLDFRLYSPSGRLLHVDVAPSDWTYTTVRVPGCGTYRLEVRNLGDVYNVLDLTVSYVA